MLHHRVLLIISSKHSLYLPVDCQVLEEWILGVQSDFSIASLKTSIKLKRGLH